MKYYKQIPAFVIVCVLLIFLYFELKSKDIHSQTVDAVTQSSAQLNQKNTHELPPKDSAYEIIGYTPGLKGYIVQYSPNLYRGGDIINEKGIEDLKNHGIKTIIAVTPQQHPRELAEKHTIQYIDFPYEYGKLRREKLIHFLDIVKNYEKPMYIHCHGGNRRAGVLCALYRIYCEDVPFEKALIEYGKLGGKVKEDFPLLNAAFSFVWSKDAKK